MNTIASIKSRSLWIPSSYLGFIQCLIFTILSDHAFTQKSPIDPDLNLIFSEAENKLLLNKYQDADSLARICLESCIKHSSPNYCKGKALSLQARIQYGLKRYPESRELFRQSLDHFRMNTEMSYIDFSHTAVRYFFLLNRMNEKDSARILLEESKSHFKLRQDTLSKAYASVIGMLGHVYSLLGRDSLALAYFEDWNKIIVLNPEAEDAQIANRCGNFHLKSLNLRQAEEQYKLAIRIAEKNAKTQSTDYATYCSNLGAVYLDLKEYPAAEPYLSRSKNIYTRLKDTASLNYYRLLNHYGIYYQGVGSLSEAKHYYKKAIQGFEADPNPDWHHLASIYFDLATIYEQSDEFNEALLSFQRSKDIRENILKILEEDYARVNAAIASIYQALGQKERALRTLQYALPILKMNLGADNFIYAEFLKNLASMNRDNKNFILADSLAKSALEIYRRTQGDRSIDYASALELLATIQFHQSAYKQALEFFNKALDIFTEKYGKNHLVVSLLQIKRADCLRDQGDHAKALRVLQESSKNIQNLLGREHSYSLEILATEARIYRDLGMKEKQKESLLLLGSRQIELILKNSLYLSANELSFYIRQFKINTDLLVDHTILYFPDHADLIQSCLQASTFYKSYVLNKLVVERRIIHSSEQTTDQVSRIRKLKEEYQISALQTGVKAYELSQMREKINDAEKLLIPRSDSLYQRFVRFDPRDQLAPKESLVDFVQYQSTGHSDSVHYAAIIYNRSQSRYSIHSLFRSTELKNFFQQNIALRSDYVERLYQPAKRGIGINGETQSSLYELIWKPVESFLAETQTLYFVPVGLLHRLNLSAVYIQDEEIMADHYEMKQLYHAAEVRLSQTDTMSLDRALIAGGINFNAQKDSTEEEAKVIPHWKDLKWTLKEAEDIGDICRQSQISNTILTRSQASESKLRNFMQQNPCSIVHIATHGFFFPQTESVHEGVPAYQRSLQQLDDPMLRSGILLAGANESWSNPSGTVAHQDGVLTAFEISSLPMDHTRLAVLSACETGLGDIDDSEGVYGLQRALKIAGVQYMIISLWQVPDKETSTFMVTFYRNLTYLHKDIEKAFMKTQQEMRERFVNPYQWAGFVLIQ